MKVTLYVHRKFDAAHFLSNHSGECRLLHGHTWKVEMWVTGVVDSKTGIVVDFGVLKAIVDQYDHGLVNDHLSTPTAELLALSIATQITERTNIHKVRVRVWESEDCSAEVSSNRDN